MASLPPQRSQNRSSAQQQNTSDEPYQQVRRANSLAPSTTSVDSQTVFLNRADSSSPSPVEASKGTIHGQDQAPSANDTRKCWICFSDETEDTPQSSPWRSPCPCALTAHEACLLDWIADIEAPSSNRTTASRSKIECPQCKHEIKLSRPHNLIVQSVNATEKTVRAMFLPLVVGNISLVTLSSLASFGQNSIQLVFGPEAAREILRPVGARHEWEHQLIRRFPQLFAGFFNNWKGLRTEVGLPLIPIALILSRTTLADPFLSFLPLAFFALREDPGHTLARQQWPPTPEMTFVMLPFVRGIYDEYLERIWGDRERQWMKEVQPSHIADSEDEAFGRGDNQRNDINDDFGIEMELQVIADDHDEDAGEEDDDEAAPVEAQPAAANNPLQAPPLNALPADEGPPQPQQQEQPRPPQQQQEQQQPNNQRHQNAHAANDRNEIVISITKIASTTFGALLFPAVSALSGGLLYMILPSSLTSTRWSRGRPVATGLLQTRWGRSIVGGCLFVVLKDAVRIYCRWRMAVAHRERRVLDYDRSKAGRLDEDNGIARVWERWIGVLGQ